MYKIFAKVDGAPTYTVSTGNDCGFSHSINFNVPLNGTSRTVMVYKDSSEAQKLSYHTSEFEDRIEKDNSDPMPFVRIISAVDCPSPSVQLVRVHEKESKQTKYTFNIDSGVDDSDYLQLKNTGKYVLTNVLLEV